jgi:HK97 gp10 family phage protein
VNRIEIKGLAELLKKLQRLGSSTTAKKVQRKAIRAGTNPLLAADRANIPVDQGDLRRAQIKKIVVNNFTCVGMVGTDTDYVGSDGSKPGKYDHLVEYGHVNPDGTVTPPNPYMRTTADQSLGAAQEAYIEKLAEEIEAEARKG